MIVYIIVKVDAEFNLIKQNHGVWRSGSARMVRDHEVVGSNPTAPKLIRKVVGFPFLSLKNTIIFLRKRNPRSAHNRSGTGQIPLPRN